MGTTETEAGIAASSDFKHSIALEKGTINHAVMAGQNIYVSTARPRGFAVVSTRGKGEILAQYEERKILGGLFTGHGEAVYAPLQNNLYQLSEEGTTELLADQKDELFGIKDVALCGEDLLILTHNGLYVLGRASLVMKASFKNDGKSVSPIKYLIDKANNRLFIADLRDEEDRRSIVLAVDMAAGYQTIWKTKVEGSLSASAGTYPVGRLQMAGGMLVIPAKNADSTQQALEFRNPATGELLGSKEVHSNRDLYSDGKLLYVLHHEAKSAAAIDPQTRTTVWTAPVDSTVKGPFRQYAGKLYAFAPGKKTVSIDMKTGKTTVSSAQINFQNVFSEDLNPDLSHFVVDGKVICWE